MKERPFLLSIRVKCSSQGAAVHSQFDGNSTNKGKHFELFFFRCSDDDAEEKIFALCLKSCN